MLDTGFARPPSPTYTAITPVTRASERNQPAALTDLPEDKTVQPSNEAYKGQQAAANKKDQRLLSEHPAPAVERRNIVDPESDSLVFVATNTETGEVVRQIPSETLLRLRAYAETIAASEGPAAPQSFQTTI
ncbi:MAG: flagellar protein FlaG [Roseibium sp.]